MAAVDRARSDISSRDNLATPTSRATSKGPASSTVSIASSDNRDDDLRKSTDGAMDKLKSRGSEDGRSDTSSHHRQRMSRIFKGRSSKRRKSATSQDDLSQLDPTEDIPPVPYVRRPSAEPRNQSDDSLGLHKSVASSLLTEDSDSET
jgi:hypothetical protein